MKKKEYDMKMKEKAEDQEILQQRVTGLLSRNYQVKPMREI